MILDRKHRMIETDHAFNRMIIQTDMRDRQFSMAGLNERWTLRHLLEGYWAFNGKIMVLRRDLHLPGSEIHHGMVGPMVAEFQLIGLETERQPKDLMPQTNAEDRISSDQCLHLLSRIGQSLWIAWPIREKHTVRFQRLNLCRACRSRRLE